MKIKIIEEILWGQVHKFDITPKNGTLFDYNVMT